LTASTSSPVTITRLDGSTTTAEPYTLEPYTPDQILRVLAGLRAGPPGLACRTRMRQAGGPSHRCRLCDREALCAQQERLNDRADVGRATGMGGQPR
jgi:hypothetical protein